MALADFDRWRPGEFMSRFSNDLALMTDAVSISLPQMVQVTVTFVSSLAVMVSIDWLLAIVHFVAGRKTLRRHMSPSRKQQRVGATPLRSVS